jgi:hypothetical protein
MDDETRRYCLGTRTARMTTRQIVSRSYQWPVLISRVAFRPAPEAGYWPLSIPKDGSWSLLILWIGPFWF